ncbi:MAG: speA [Firmicutes bacterium]|nr:speA [Bacillota bacterium]
MKYKQTETPLLDAMQNYVADGALAFHTPGHKQGKGMHKAFKELVTATGLAMEVSLMEELDDLHEPQTCLKAAQELAAELYGADESYFVINGTTGAIHAMILAVVNPGDKIIVPRNAHRSIIGGIMLSGAIPVFMQPEVDEQLGIAMAVTPEIVAKTIEDNLTAKAVLVVNPTYYGVSADLKKIADIVHQHHMILVVDEAHGPHLKFHDALPVQAMDAGADLVAQSTHKILGSMTQSSMLHVRRGRIDINRVRTMLSLVQSTSPNYLLMASLDVARMQMATGGKASLAKAVELANWARSQINEIDGLYCFGAEKMAASNQYTLDVTKLTVTVKMLGLSGAEAEQILRYQYKIQSELSDIYNVLFIISYADGKEEVERLVNALKELASKHARTERNIDKQVVVYPAVPTAKLSPRQALFASKRAIAFTEAEGMVCSEVITFYPPGIPIICPGEIISQEVINYCLRMQEVGLKVVGPDDVTLKTIKIVHDLEE